MDWKGFYVRFQGGQFPPHTKVGVFVKYVNAMQCTVVQIIVLIIQVNITISTSMPSESMCSPSISLHLLNTPFTSMFPSQCVHFTCSAHRASTAWSTSLLSFSCLTFGTSKMNLGFKFCFGSFATLDKGVCLMVDEKYEGIYDNYFYRLFIDLHS